MKDTKYHQYLAKRFIHSVGTSGIDIREAIDWSVGRADTFSAADANYQKIREVLLENGETGLVSEFFSANGPQRNTEILMNYVRAEIEEKRNKLQFIIGKREVVMDWIKQCLRIGGIK